VTPNQPTAGRVEDAPEIQNPSGTNAEHKEPFVDYYSPAYNKLKARNVELEGLVGRLRETLVAIKAVNITEFGTPADLAINRLIDTSEALAQPAPEEKPV